MARPKSVEGHNPGLMFFTSNFTRYVNFTAPWRCDRDHGEDFVYSLGKADAEKRTPILKSVA